MQTSRRLDSFTLIQEIRAKPSVFWIIHPASHLRLTLRHVAPADLCRGLRRFVLRLGMVLDSG